MKSSSLGLTALLVLANFYYGGLVGTAFGADDLNSKQNSQNSTEVTPPSLSSAELSIGQNQKANQEKEAAANADRRVTDTAKEKPRKAIRRGNAPCTSWIDQDQPVKAALLCLHGLGLHATSYNDFGQRLSKKGIATYAIDIRGFGSWALDQDGRTVIDFDGALDDITKTLKVIHRLHPRVPVFILGESMGGAIALRETAEHPDLVDGLISSVPAADRFKQEQTSFRVAIDLIKSPHKDVDVGKGIVKQATQNPELRTAWESDPLARMDISPVELVKFQQFMNQNHKMAKLITTQPVLIIQGCEDKLVKPEGTIRIYKELKTTDRQILLIPKAEHLIFEEGQCSDQVFDAVISWLNRHSTKSNTSGPAVEELPKL